MPGTLLIEAFYEPATFTFSYLVMDTASRAAAVIDSVLDFDTKSGRTRTDSADHLLARARQLQADVLWHLETHVHADHLSAAPYLMRQLGGQTVIGADIRHVQQVFGKLFNLGDAFKRDGSQFSRLISDGETLPLGRFNIRAMHTPGHTPACMTYLIDDGERLHAFVGDTLFMPDYGTARCDFPGGSAQTLYASIHKVLDLPDNTQLYMCHDYPPAGRGEQFLSTVKLEREGNVHVGNGVSREAFVAMREKRDATLSMPALLLPAVQVNMRAGEFPPAEDNGVSYLKLPINLL
ncbi:MAG TPA: MBL fold metallo-hydrolase [Arenimonas sp.]|nr:MBL fold metallo-hydrolase [Arenimonas sp.]